MCSLCVQVCATALLALLLQQPIIIIICAPSLNFIAERNVCALQRHFIASNDIINIRLRAQLQFSSSLVR